MLGEKGTPLPDGVLIDALLDIRDHRVRDSARARRGRGPRLGRTDRAEVSDDRIGGKGGAEHFRFKPALEDWPSGARCKPRLQGSRTGKGAS